MTNRTANPQVAEIGSDPFTRRSLTGRRRSGLAGMAGRISTKARWLITAAIGLIAPAVLIAESAAAPIAEAMACFGNGALMSLAAAANAFMMVP